MNLKAKENVKERNEIKFQVAVYLCCFLMKIVTNQHKAITKSKCLRLSVLIYSDPDDVNGA